MRISDWSSDVCSSDLPCFLGDWRQRHARAEQPAGLVLAYVGEIKQEKGFIDLPARLAAMLRDGECRDQRFLVQVNEARTPTAREILGQLHAMAGSEPRIGLHELGREHVCTPVP